MLILGGGWIVRKQIRQEGWKQDVEALNASIFQAMPGREHHNDSGVPYSHLNSHSKTAGCFCFLIVLWLLYKNTIDFYLMLLYPANLQIPLFSFISFS